MSWASGVGSLLGGTGSLISSVGSLFPTTTNSSSSGTASSSSSANSSTTATGVTTGSQSGQSNTTTENETVNSADPGVIAALKTLVEQANGFADNAGKYTNGVVTDLFQQAKDAFAGTLGTQAGSGLYNSATTQVLGSAAEARATADAASAVLGFQTQEQGIADNGLAQLLQATATSTSKGGSQTNYTSNATQDTTQTSNTQQSGKTNQSEQSQSTSTTGKDSVVCTWMYAHGKLPARKFAISHRHYDSKYSELAKDAYLFWGNKFVRVLKSDINSVFSRAIISLFRARTDYICAKFNAEGCKKTWYGLFSFCFIHAICIPVGLLLLPSYLINKYTMKKEV